MYNASLLSLLGTLTFGISGFDQAAARQFFGVCLLLSLFFFLATLWQAVVPGWWSRVGQRDDDLQSWREDRDHDRQYHGKPLDDLYALRFENMAGR